MSYSITSIEQLESLYGKPSNTALGKVSDHLTPAYQAWLEKTAFFAFASGCAEGLDCSPRGDERGKAFILLDNKTIVIPDRRGNNRLDTLRNIVRDPHVAMLCLIPGITEALRINGQAILTTDPALLSRFDMQGRTPTSVIKIDINAVYFQCARAIMRSGLWDSTTHLTAEDVPSPGEMTKSVINDFDADKYDAELRDRQAKTLY